MGYLVPDGLPATPRTEAAPQVKGPGGPQAICASGDWVLCLATLATDSNCHPVPRRVRSPRLFRMAAMPRRV